MEFLACGGEFSEMLHNGTIIPVLAIALGCCVGVVAIVGGTLGGIMKTRAKEMTKRELAAYVAEGTLDPDKAVMMLNAGMKRWETPDMGKHV